jgi:hypothetical protein
MAYRPPTSCAGDGVWKASVLAALLRRSSWQGTGCEAFCVCTRDTYAPVRLADDRACNSCQRRTETSCCRVLDGEIGGPPQPNPETMNVSASSRLMTLVGEDTSCSADTPHVKGAATATD